MSATDDAAVEREAESAAPKRRVGLVLQGPHTRAVADLCAACPSGETGCCSQPPDLSWADVGRVASLGGARFLEDELSAGRLVAGPRGLAVQRIPGGPSGGTKCGYHGERGCTLSPERRSAACNYYICPEALAEAGDEALVVEAGSLAWTAAYHQWNEALSEEVERLGTPTLGEALFAELGRLFLERSASR